MKTVKETNKQTKITSSLQSSSGLYVGDLACSGKQPHFTYPFTETP